MSTNKILIILGEPNSTFSEVLFKYFCSKFIKQNKNKIILIGNKKLFQRKIFKLKYNFKVKEISSLKKYTAKEINIINVDYKFKKTFSEITSNSKKYIEKCFELGLKIMGEKMLNLL